ncbi:2-oxo-tetronate isomerase [Ottowia sp.]|uniref:2-oxo-tetronate isomerase n=1 Tax=Ottowia sp. TaxID=1898956 RepID=UPI002C72FBF0|nr:2-oxo-tetronate isomerase [Ottowia sp.]HOB65092.1 hydroxypyruvate isomerase family protein [Ottowia sp.]HPZ56273.1 hydroxypyruvate isomerase family protein [Ottowia sp.]HQD46561.1 hydroxypyruvate isomerase family protein [Ottowia sp.]
MPRFAANLSLMYPELPFLDRFEAAARDGFEAVEYLFPYAFDAAEIVARLKAHRLQQVLFNAPPGGTDAASIDAAWAAGARGTASVPGREAEFRAGVQLALRYADALDCPRIHCMAGLLDESAAGARQTSAARSVYVSNLRWAAAEAAKSGRAILIEPINPRDMPGYFLNRQDEAHAIVQEVGAPNLQVQMDLYHCQIVEGDVAMKIRQYLPTGRVGHLQIAGVPERQEPDVGELNYGYLFDVIDDVSAQCGWAGWLGCEYRPRWGGEPQGTSRGLDWLRRRAG